MILPSGPVPQFILRRNKFGQPELHVPSYSTSMTIANCPKPAGSAEQLGSCVAVRKAEVANSLFWGWLAGFRVKRGVKVKAGP